MPVAKTMALAGRTVTRIGLGTNRLTDTPQNREFLSAAVEAGLNHIDTAHLYSGGESERTIAAALAPFPHDLVVATKAGYNRGGGRPERLRAEIEESFRRFGVETIALYYLHRVDPEVPLLDQVGVLKEYRDAGRIEHVGLSEVSIEQIELANTLVPIAAVQNEYGLGQRKYDEVVDFCAERRIAFVPFFPLRRQGRAALDEVAARYDATRQQVALAWLLRRSPTMAPIPGTLSLEHLTENLAAVEIELSDEDFERLGSGHALP
jgi:pyridoxine 4-dehydrogenase